MDIIMPDREAVKRNGWVYQVQWIEDGKPCFVRCKSGREADGWADKLKRGGLSPVVVDLHDQLQLH